MVINRMKVDRLAGSLERRKFLVCVTLAFAIGSAAANPVVGELPTNDDPTQQIRYKTARDAEATRSRLVHFIWDGGLPSTLPKASKNVELPSLSIGLDPANIASIDKLVADVSGWDFYSTSYLLHPVNNANSHRAVILHQGHSRNLELGIGTTANHLLRNGFTVVVMNMPLHGWNNDDTATVPGIGSLTYSNHDSIIHTTTKDNHGQGFRLFLEPVIQSINHLAAQSDSIKDISMIGLSGGGWTTQMIAAIDPRISLSIPIAGSCPLYHRNIDPQSAGDAEQVYPPLYDENIRSDGSGGGVATWLEIYVLGALGPGRRQIQVSNQFDSCCFAGTFAERYAPIVKSALKNVGEGQWDHRLDSSHGAHQISDFTRANIVDPSLGISTSETPRSGLPKRDDFDDQENELPNGWSIDPHYGRKSDVRETKGKVDIESPMRRAKIYHNSPANPQAAGPFTIVVQMDSIPPDTVFEVGLASDVDAESKLVRLLVNGTTHQLALAIKNDEGHDRTSATRQVAKIPSYDGGPMLIRWLFSSEGMNIDVRSGDETRHSSDTILWSDLKSSFDFSSFGEHSYLYLGGSRVADGAVEGPTIDFVEMKVTKPALNE
jgi:hypothetical protein